MLSLIDHVGILTAIIIVGIVRRLWHTLITISIRSSIKKIFPWISIRQVLISYATSCNILLIPAIPTINIVQKCPAPLAAFNGAINALYRIPQFVTETKVGIGVRIGLRLYLIFIIAWSIMIVVTLASSIDHKCGSLSIVVIARMDMSKATRASCMASAFLL